MNRRQPRRNPALMGRVMITLPRRIIDDLDRIADREGRSRSNTGAEMLRRAITKELARYAREERQ